MVNPASVMVKEQYQWGPVRDNGERQGDKSNTNNWGKLQLPVKYVKPNMYERD